MAAKREFKYRCIVISNETYESDPDKWGKGASSFTFSKKVTSFDFDSE